MPRTRVRTPVPGLRTAWPWARPAGAAACAALIGGTVLVAGAAPALAASDPARPQATVTRGPSCAPGGVELRVQAGTAAVHVVLATTRHPEGEDVADLPAGGSAVLRTGDVAWGETVDSRLVSTAADGQTWVDELDDWTLTRPTEADCAIAAGPAVGAPVGGAPTAVVSEGAGGADGAASHAVGAGRPITVTGSGFAPGERVTVSEADGPGVLARGTAGPDGTVSMRLTVPPRARGATGLDLTGGSSGTAARLELQVAALRLPLHAAGRSGSPVAAAVALACLTATGTALVPLARRSAALRRGAVPPGAVPPGGAPWGGAPVGARDGARPPR